MFETGALPEGVRFSQVESDAFFTTYEGRLSFDLCLVDGLHNWEQSYRDILNCFNMLAIGGLVLVDDVIPDDEVSGMRSYEAAMTEKARRGSSSRRWQGDVCRALDAICKLNPELDHVVIGSNRDGDNPQAVIWKTQETHQSYDINQLLEQAKLSGLATVEEIIGTHGQSFKRVPEETFFEQT